MELNKTAMVTSPTGKGVILMGGRTEGQKISKAIFELTDSMEWNPMEQTLKHDHFEPLAIPIPDDLVKEKVKNRNEENCM